MSAVNVPEKWQTLVDVLRCAVHNTAPSQTLLHTDWDTLLTQARKHCVENFLYPWLARHIPEMFSMHVATPPASPCVAWRSLALDHLKTSTLRSSAATDILREFAQNNVEVIPLKGIWLSETLYDEPSQRFMVDIDLLVRRSDVKRAQKLLNKLGYNSAQIDTDNQFAYDAKFSRAGDSFFIELHWNVESHISDRLAIPDIEAIWRDTTPASLLQHPVQALSNEALVTQLVQHILHHQFATPLRSYIDIALLLRNRADQLDPEKLAQAASTWKTGRSVLFVLNMISTLFEIPLPTKLMNCQFAADADFIQQAWQCVFNLPEMKSRVRELNLLKYREATLTERLKLIFKRIFVPRSYMMLRYPYAKYAVLLPVAWVQRTVTLGIETGCALFKTPAENDALSNAAIRRDIIVKLLEPH